MIGVVMGLKSLGLNKYGGQKKSKDILFDQAHEFQKVVIMQSHDCPKCLRICTKLTMERKHEKLQ